MGFKCTCRIRRRRRFFWDSFKMICIDFVTMCNYNHDEKAIMKLHQTNSLFCLQWNTFGFKSWRKLLYFNQFNLIQIVGLESFVWMSHGKSFEGTFHWLSNLVEHVSNRVPKFANSGTVSKWSVFAGVVSHMQWNHRPWNLLNVVRSEIVVIQVVPCQSVQIIMGMSGGSESQK